MRKFLLLFFIISFSFTNLSFANDEAQEEEEEGFFSRTYRRQLRPIVEQSLDDTGKSILTYGGIATLLAFALDNSVYEFNKDHPNRYMDDSTSHFFSNAGDGKLGIGIAVAQLFWDRENGIKHAWALFLTSTTHFTTAAIVQRDRPHGKLTYLPFPSSFPSGHSSSAFTTAASLQNAYGDKVGIFSFAFAGAISASRIQQEAHWLSDVMAGATLGSFWAHASSKLDLGSPDKNGLLYPSVEKDQFAINFLRSF